MRKNDQRIQSRTVMMKNKKERTHGSTAEVFKENRAYCINSGNEYGGTAVFGYVSAGSASDDAGI